MKRNRTNEDAGVRPVAETVNVPCMSQKELIVRLNKSNKKLLALNKELSLSRLREPRIPKR